MSDSLDMKAVRQRFEDAWEFDRANREAARDDLKHLKGDQWPEAERQQRENDQRPYLTLNRLPQQVRQVTGDLRQNRPAVRVLPTDGAGDKEVAKIFAGLIRNIETRSKGKRPYITAGMQAARCGIGHFRVLTDYAHAETFDQDIFIEPIPDALSVVWDPMARDVTRADAQFCFVEENIRRDDFKHRWPKAKIADFEGGDADSDAHSWFQEDLVRIAEYWVKEPVKRRLLMLVNGQTVFLDALDEDERETAESFAIAKRDVESHVVKMWKVSGLEALEEPQEWPTPDIPIIAVTGEEIVIDSEVHREGVIRHAKDAQRMYNYWNTANAEFVALQPKQPYIAEQGQILPFARDWKEANKANRPVLPYKNVPGVPPPQRQTPAMASPGMVQAMQLAAEDIKATTGIYDAALGAKSNETSGKAIFARQAESDVSTYYIADHVSAAVQQCGRVLVDLIPRIYDTERVIRIVNEDDSDEFVTVNKSNAEMGEPALNDLSVGRYDVDVATGPSFNTRRQEAAESLIQFAQVAPEARPLILDLVAKNMDWPGADEIADRLRKMLPPGVVEGDDEEEMTPERMAQQQAQAQQAELAQAQAALELEKLRAEVDKIKADAGSKTADSQQTELETAQAALELAAQTGQLQEMVRAQVIAEITEMMARQSAPAPGYGV